MLHLLERPAIGCSCMCPVHGHEQCPAAVRDSSCLHFTELPRPPLTALQRCRCSPRHTGWPTSLLAALGLSELQAKWPQEVIPLGAKVGGLTASAAGEQPHTQAVQAKCKGVQGLAHAMHFPVFMHSN